MNWFGVTSYGLSALVFGALGLALFFGPPKGSRPGAVIAAAGVTALWAAVTASMSGTGGVPLQALAVADSLHSLVWLAAILSFLAPPTAGSKNMVRRWLGGSGAVLASWTVIAPLIHADRADPSMPVFVGLVGMAVTGLVAVEQVFRNAREEQQGPFRRLCLAIGGIFTADLVIYSHATLLGGVLETPWDSRGLANALCAPIILVALRRDSAWTKALVVSRQIAFYTATLLGVGAYLLGMALLAYVIRAVGGQWALWLEPLFLLAALLVLGVVLFSTGIRARLRVFLIKNFYRSKYDYRREWLRLTETLADTGDMRSLAQRALEGVAAIVGSPTGDLFITTDGKHYDWFMSLTTQRAAKIDYRSDHAMVGFLATKRWVIDTHEYAQYPDRYDSALGAPRDGAVPANSLVVPLHSRGHLQGFIVLERPPHIGWLNFDDHDILKTAGQQVAVFLSQALAQEQLVETRQFEAVNRLTTFLVHDLKNVLAQQELVVANAQRFGDRPEFIKDAIATISSGVQRMKKVLEQLRSNGFEAKVITRANLVKVLQEVRAQCGDREPVPIFQPVDEQISIDIDGGQLVSALVHVVRNAQDATPASGRIEISATRVDGEVHVLVSDTGTGMEMDFVRDHLFAPFKSTKGGEGMGIGAYQARELVRSAGGGVQVTSSRGQGTVFRFIFPYERARRRAASDT
jgi:putative PEP-CTERM system histidine kinase